MFDIVALGELLIDFTQAGFSPAGLRLFEQNPGGAPCNMLSAATKLGSRTAFIGKVGDDMHGAFLHKTVAEAGIDVSGLSVAHDAFTTLAFVSLENNGERHFSFSRKPGADTRLSINDIPSATLQNCRVFHFGSLSLTDEPARGATLHALQTAKQAGAVITYDPNYRAALWCSPEEAAFQMRSPLKFVDIIKISDEELELVTGFSSPEPAAAMLHALGIVCVVITLGENGAMISLNGEQQYVEAAPDSAVIDKTGAGDCFFGAFINRFLASGKTLAALSIADVAAFAAFANAAATLCISKRGGIPAMPSLDEVQNKMEVTV